MLCNSSRDAQEIFVSTGEFFEVYDKRICCGTKGPLLRFLYASGVVPRERNPATWFGEAKVP